MMNKQTASLIAAGASVTATLRTASGDLVPDSVLRVEQFEEKISLLSVVLLRSDVSSLEVARKRPDAYWRKIQLLIAPYISSSLSDLSCKVHFYKLLDTYKYLLTNLMDWTPQSLQRLWPFFTMFHAFPDLTPFCANIVKLRVQYDMSQKSSVSYVTGCDLVALRNPAPCGFSSAPPVSTACVPRIAANGASSTSATTGKVDIPNGWSPAAEEVPVNEVINGFDEPQSEAIPYVEVKSIVQEIVSKMSFSMTNGDNDIG